MKHLSNVTIYYWSANHIALNITQAAHIYENNKVSAEFNEDGELVKSEKFRALTHNSDTELRCTTNYTPETFNDLINTLFDNKKEKIPEIIDDFWEDCSQYIRDDQIELLKLLYQIMTNYCVFDDDEDLEDGYDDALPDNVEELRQFGIEITAGSEKRAHVLLQAQVHQELIPLVEKLREDKTALEK